jgi:hypothetical protein
MLWKGCVKEQHKISVKTKLAQEGYELDKPYINFVTPGSCSSMSG